MEGGKFAGGIAVSNQLSINLFCPHCGQKLALPTEDLHRSFRCPRCQREECAANLIPPQKTVPAVPIESIRAHPAAPLFVVQDLLAPAVAAPPEEHLATPPQSAPASPQYRSSAPAPQLFQPFESPLPQATTPHPVVILQPATLARASALAPVEAQAVLAFPCPAPVEAQAGLTPPVPVPENLATSAPIALRGMRAVLHLAERIDALSYGNRLTIIYALACIYCLSVIASAIWSIPALERGALIVFFLMLGVYGLARVDAFRTDDGRWTWSAALRGLRGGWGRARDWFADWRELPVAARRTSLTSILVMGGCLTVAVRGGFEWVLAPKDSMFFLLWAFIGWAAIAFGLYRWYTYRSPRAPRAKELPPANVLCARASGLPAVIDLVRDREASLQRAKAGADDYLYSLLVVLAEWKPRPRGEPLEADYHDSLHRFLRKRAPQLQVERERPINAVIEGTRRRLDLAIDGRVVIELKRHLRRTADADRAYGQIRGYAQAWPHGPVLLVLCETSDDFAQQRGLQNKMEELRAANYAVVAIAAGRRARA